MARPKESDPINGWVYDLILKVFDVPINLFFREVYPRGVWKIPKDGAVIFVAAPHANQFVDSFFLMKVVSAEAGRRVALLMAAKSLKRAVIGSLSKGVGALPVARSQDNLKPGKGTIYLPDPQNQPTLLCGIGTAFDGPEFEVGGTISLPSINGRMNSSRIQEILGPEEIVLKTPFEGSDPIFQLTGRHGVNGDVPNPSFGGCKFKVAPHVDQTEVYDAVFKRLNAGGCVGIFPEGGSHDRPSLLPLKAGVAIMALGALAMNPDCNLKIVPCGMNYFHAHKFRSRAVIEFGNPFDVPPELVQQYKEGKRRQAVGVLLEIIYQALVGVTVLSPDYETLMLAQAVRRLYNPTGKRLPLSKVVEINRRLVKGYSQYQSDPRMKQLKESVKKYNEQLRLLGIYDHQVEYARFSIVKVVSTLIYRVAKISVLAVGTVPGLILFAPVFIVSKYVSHRKSQQDLKASTVKLQGHDVMATWKLLISLAFAPLLYAWYTVILTCWYYYNRVEGYAPIWTENRVPMWLLIMLELIVFISVTFAALLIGEVGMDILKSLRPLVLCLNPTSANTLGKLREQRKRLSKEVTELMNDLAPDMFPDCDALGTVAPSETDEVPNTSGEDIQSQKPRPRNSSLHNLADIGFFSNPEGLRMSSSLSAGDQKKVQ